MPTGYTDAVFTKQQTFEQFALSCARAFGALVEMRDAANDAPIPQEFFPSDYHQKAADQARERLAFLTAMSPAEICLWGRLQIKERLDDLQQSKRGDAQRARIESYERMLVQVRAWTPPTPEHENLKKFMTDQLKESIQWDKPSDYYDEEIVRISALTAQQYHANEVQDAAQSLQRNIEEHDKEVRRCAERNAWVKALRSSLK